MVFEGGLIMKIEVHFSKYLSEVNNDVWKFQTVEAINNEEAIEKIVKEHTKDDAKVNYILSCTPIE